MIDAAIVKEAVARASASGSLAPIITETTVVSDAGVDFVVRAASSLAAKAKAPTAATRADPLGEYEPDLFVADLPPAHYVLLNKYPVMAGHLLIVTRDFEPQERLLGRADLAALASMLARMDGLGFYNAGGAAGASQGRKHLQFVPLPLAPEMAMPVPLEPVIERSALPFRHAFSPLGAIEALHDTYRKLLERCAITAVGADERQSAPYNLLLTRHWMLLVPRSRERYGSISVNALGFAGSLFVREHAELELVRRVGPMNILRAVAVT